MLKKLLYMLCTYVSIIILTLAFIKWAIYIGAGRGIYILYVALLISNIVYILIDILWIWFADFLADVLWVFFSFNKKYSLPILEFLICIIYLVFCPSEFDGQLKYLSYFPVLIPKFVVLVGQCFFYKPKEKVD